MPDLRDIVARGRDWERLGARQADNTWREVHRLDGRFVIKSFTIPLTARRYRRPWVREHEALTRAPPHCAPESLGWFEDLRERDRIVRFGRTYLPGTVADVLSEAYAEPAARLLARLHRHGIVTDDANAHNFLVTPDGDLRFLDLGRAHLGRPDRWSFQVRIGRELAKLRREGFGWQDPAWQAFCDGYFREQQLSAAAAATVRLSARVTARLRRARMTFKGRSPWE